MLACLLLAACAGAGAVPTVPHEPPVDVSRPPPRTTLAFDCGGLAVTAQFERDAAWVFLPERTVHLALEPAASGARYAGDGVTFWSKGDDALLDDAGRTRRCRIDRQRTPWEDAKLRGVDFRATGNEPGWTVEIERGRRIVFVTDYGARRVEVPAPDPTVDRLRRETRYEARTEAHHLIVTISAGSCRDDMSGEPRESVVTVTLDGRARRGCGRALH